MGLGIPLFAATGERWHGQLDIDSRPSSLTALVAMFQHSHIDRTCLGDLPGTLICVLMRDDALHARYRHAIVEHSTQRSFETDTAEITGPLGNLPRSLPAVREWLSEYDA